MKKLILLIAAVVIGHTTVFSQGCLPEGITITSQAQIDSFQINYPGCTEIEGDVMIGGMFHDITNLLGLSVLTTIGGNLKIQTVWELHSLAGLENLSYIGGDLSINNNDSLTSLTGLDNLTSIGGDLLIGDGYGINDEGNDSLTSLTGVGNLSSIGGCLRIEGNDYLENISGLSTITSVGGCIGILGNYSLISLSGLDNIIASSVTDLNISHNSALSTCNVQSICNYLASPNGIVDIYDNAPGCNNPLEIASLCGISLPCLPFGNYYFYTQADLDNFQTNYPGCTILGGNVNINGNDIVNIDGLNQVTSITGSLIIGELSYPLVGNPLLSNLSGLGNLASIGGDLLLGHNDTLTSLSGLDNLSYLGGSLLIGLGGGGSSKSTASMKSLTSIEALGNLSIVPGELYIGNTGLHGLSGLDSLTSVGTNITISSNGSLSDISSLAKLTSITGSLGIYSTAITNFIGLNNVPIIVGNFRIADNQCIKDFGGLENLSSIGGAWISGNDSLVSMAGLNALVSIEDFLWVTSNHRLTSFTGLERLTSLTDLSIINNPALNTLTGLDSINSNSLTNLEIRGNSSLSSCEVQSICDYLASPNGTVNIASNASGCNSPEEVEAACQVGIEDINTNFGLAIYPNPSPGQFTFEFSLQQQSMVSLFLLNSLGQVVATLVDEVLTSGSNQLYWNAESLPAGIYCCRLLSGDQVTAKKIIKLN